MKKAFLIFVLWDFCVFFPAVQLFSQGKIPDKQLIATLEEGESFVYGESCFTLTSTKTGIYFVTRKGGKFFIYEDGIKKGPFNTISEDMLKKCDSPVNPLCATFNPTDCLGDDPYSKFITSDENGSLSIKIKDKIMGPYLAVMQFSITCDASKFAALVMAQDQTIHFIHSGGKDILIDGMPQWLLLSPDGDQAIAAFGKNIDPSKIDMNNINIADFTSFHIIDLNEKIYGPYNEQDYSGNFWFSKTGGSHWYFSKEGQIFRDGNPWMKELSGYGPCELWISKDGSKTAVVDYGQGTLKETDKLWLIQYPLEIKTFQEGNKTMIRWISLEGERNIVAYKKVL